MSDTQAAMREFRFLDEKRKVSGLAGPEEQRWQELAAHLGVDISQQQPQGYWADDGNWYPYPEGYDPNAYADQQQAAADGQGYGYDAQQGQYGYGQPQQQGDPN